MRFWQRPPRFVRYISGGLGLLVALVCTPTLELAHAAESRLRFYHYDSLGSTTLVTDAQGQVVYQTAYTPYGATATQTGSPKPAHQFTGQRLDTGTGLYYYKARYYDPQLGRFTQPDPFVQNPADPQTLNRYAYVRNNPTNLVDPSGHFFQFIIAAIVAALKAAVIGAAVGAVVNGAVAAVRGQPIGSAAWRGATVGAVSGGVLGAGGYLIGPQVLALGGTAKTLAEIGLSAASGAVGGGVDSRMQGGAFSRGLVPGAVGGMLGYGISEGIGAIFRIPTETPNTVQLGNQAALSQQTRQFLGEVGLGAESGGGDVYNAIMRQVERLDVSTPPNGAVFWKGYTQGNQTAAMQWARQTGRSTLEMTPGGQWLDSLHLYEPTGPLTRSQADAVWQRLSQRFAAEAQGEATVFLERTSFNPGSTFDGTEWPALYGNPQVSRIRRR